MNDRNETMKTKQLLEPLKPYAEWRAMGPEKAAEYLARRNGWDAKRQRKLWAILEVCWQESS